MTSGPRITRKRHHYSWHPIYDWSDTDVWKAIVDHGWPYNRHHDALYRYGTPVHQMRVSNIHHETAVRSLFHLQELEPDTYERAVRRIGGLDMAGKLQEDFYARELPFMFPGWGDRDYLLPRLIDKPEWQQAMRKTFNTHERLLPDDWHEKAAKAHVQAILTHDWEGVKLNDFFAAPETKVARRRKRAERAAQAEQEQEEVVA